MIPGYLANFIQNSYRVYVHPAVSLQVLEKSVGVALSSATKCFCGGSDGDWIYPLGY